MVKKQQPGDDEGTSAAQFASSIRESAQQIWLAGLGAFSKAQEEGGKVFESLVREGATIQRRTQSAAEDKLAEAGTRMASMASELSNRASSQWDKLEGLFEERVARALRNLDVPTGGDTDDLVRRVEELERTVASLRAGAARSPARKVAAKRPAAKAPRKRPSARKAAD